MFPNGNVEAVSVATVIRSTTDFGRAVRDRRRALALTQEELAARCGVGKRFIVDLEAGKFTIQLGKALTAAREVGIVLADTRRQLSGASAEADPSNVDGFDPLADLPRF